MSKTVKELADELGVSKQTIQYHYQRLPANKRQKDRQTSTNSGKNNIDIIATMKDEIAYLRADRDKQFAAKDQQIEKLQKLLDQSQQLQLMTAQKLKQLEKPKNERESDSKEKDEQIHARASGVPTAVENSADKPATFWQRLFGEQNNK